uniref:G_PROTEIN_RECEP_F1_2 domain-containing protein n=1 Tax=Panagrellus redivivus TaxID=6233 RepID=A0A7E4VTU5_PANRE
MVVSLETSSVLFGLASIGNGSSNYAIELIFALAVVGVGGTAQARSNVALKLLASASLDTAGLGLSLVFLKAVCILKKTPEDLANLDCFCAKYVSLNPVIMTDARIGATNIGSEQTGWSLALALSLGVINAVVVVGNVFVLYILVTQKSLHTSTNFIVLSLTLADFLLGVVILPFSFLQEYYSEWVFDELWCKLWLALDVLFSTASIYNLLAISFDRYMAVRQPIKYRFISSKKMTRITIMIVWIISAALAFAPLIYDYIMSTEILSISALSLFGPNSLATNFDKPVNRSNSKMKTVCSPMTSSGPYILFSAMISFILPAIFMIISNICIFQTVLGSSRQKLLPLPMSGLGSKANQAPRLRVHRGGGANSSIFIQRSRDSNTASVRRNRPYLSTATRSYSSSFRSKNDDVMCVQPASPLSVKLERKKSSSMSTLNKLPEELSMSLIKQDASSTLPTESEESSWVTSVQSNKGNNMIQGKTEKLNTVVMHTGAKNADGKEYFTDLQKDNLMSKTTSSTVWYPAIIASMMAGKRARKCSEQLLFMPVCVNRQSMRTEVRVARTIGIVVGCFTICWLPFTVIYILQAFKTCPIDDCVPGWLFTTAFWLGYANSAVNPLLYAAVSRDFRCAFKKVLTGKKSSIRNRFYSSY